MNYKHYMGIQMVEVREHKYFLSKKQGVDVGMSYAMDNWILSGHAKRFHDTYEAHMDTIEAVCDACDKCETINDCRLPNDIVHKLMED